ncbi:MAG: Stk1 family PASTA domain-containing Ser/Thr kinase [Jatrophihabitans sp.]
MQTAALDVLVGRKFEGRYRILDRIARGGMSTVYAAVDERLDRLVAVKVMSSALSSDPAFSDRFAREARAAARLTHLNVVSVYDQGHEIAQDGHHVFLVMELVEGRTLRELIRERGKLSPAEAISIMEPVLSALAAAHRAGLVHRDVKPENILLSDEGVVKVADFGLARAVESDAAATRTGLMMGTVAYCAPEQISKGRADPRSDVYSAGVVLFELLTGSPPYQGDSAMNVAYQHVHNRVPAPSSRVRGLPTEIDEVVVAATDSDPTGRPPDAASFLAEVADLRTALALPVTPVPPRVRERKQRPDHRAVRERTPDRDTTANIRRQLASDTAIVAHGAANGTGTSRLDGRSQHTGRAAAPPPPVVIPPTNARTRRRRRGVIGFLLVILLGVGIFFGAKAFVEWRFAHVPSVVKLSEADAVSQLHDAGYDVKVLPGRQYSPTVRAGFVISTDPQDGTRLATGGTVKVTLSLGPKLYRLPQTRNQSLDQATLALRGLGNLTINPAPKLQTDDTIAEGRVIGTLPSAGTNVTDRQSITIIVSKGPPMVSVPQIADGTPADAAEQTLTNAKFKVKRVQQYSDTVAAGDVISVDPTDTATKFSTITLTVSRGPEFVTVPAIAMLTPVADAEKAIRAAHLVPVVQGYKILPPSPHGVVLMTDPGAGKRVHSGSTVTLTTI